MIELPEAVTLARQMTAELKGKQIEYASRGNAPMKFAFYNRTPEEYEAILKGMTLGETKAHGTKIITTLEPDYFLVLGEGGERILFHTDEANLPKKHQFFLRFKDGTYLTVNIQLWGAVQLVHQSELTSNPFTRKTGVSPLSEAFSLNYYLGLYEGLEETDARSIKYFIISDPGIWGVANGYLQDILYRAKIHPKRRAAEIHLEEKRALYEAIRITLKEAVDSCGRDTEYDLYNHPGSYRKILDAKSVGKPCPSCSTPIQKIQFLGGACYFCPRCQV